MNTGYGSLLFWLWRVLLFRLWLTPTLIGLAQWSPHPGGSSQPGTCGSLVQIRPLSWRLRHGTYHLLSVLVHHSARPFQSSFNQQDETLTTHDYTTVHSSLALRALPRDVHSHLTLSLSRRARDALVAGRLYARPDVLVSM